MRLLSFFLIASSLVLGGCSDAEEPLQGWKESDVEIVNEGTAPGTSREVVLPGDATSTPMTGTNFDTSTDLDMITDEQLGLEGEDDLRETAERTVGSLTTPIGSGDDDAREKTPVRSMSERRPDPEPRRASPAPAPTTSTGRQTTPPLTERQRETEPESEQERPSSSEPDSSAPLEDDTGTETSEPEEEDEPEEEESIRQGETLPPVVIPAPGPQNEKKKPESDPPPTATDTGSSEPDSGS